MSDASEVRGRRGVERMVFFSDAVVAIAITLVVLPLVDDAREMHHGSLSSFFTEDGFGLVAAVVSFVAIGRFWVAHHGIFVRATGYTNRLLTVNLLWLAGIASLPLATVLDVSWPVSGAPVYIGVLAFILAMERLEELVLIRHDLLEDHPHLGARQEWATWTPIVILIIAVVATALVPRAGLLTLLLLIVSRPIRRVIAGPV